MNIDLTEKETSVLSRLAGGGIAPIMREYASHFNSLAEAVPLQLRDLLNERSIFFETAVLELGRYTRFLMDLIALYEKISYKTQTTSYYTKHLGEIAAICDNIEIAQTDGEFFD
ncbi:hypothetical protein [uncultured Fibrobacter sp.]|uniref:hypothetical protein n=1 Tax=uncultured Fibrobacter sp. TaxID=261512 RepID=UPI0025EC117A|nr:hypothetical protein [uncultured Fibrobacter sp.]